VLSVRVHAGSDPPGDEQLAMASVYFRVHDYSGLYRSVGGLPGWQLAWRLILYGKKMQINYSWQFIIAGTVILLAVAYLIRRALRSWRMTGRGCGGSCGCANADQKKDKTSFVPISELTLRSSERNHESHELHG